MTNIHVIPPPLQTLIGQVSKLDKAHCHSSYLYVLELQLHYVILRNILRVICDKYLFIFFFFVDLVIASYIDLVIFYVYNTK